MTSSEDLSTMGKTQLHKCGEWAKHGIEEAKSLFVAQRASSDPKVMLYGAACICLALWLLIRGVQYFKKPACNILSTPQLEKATTSFKAPQREPGGWS